MAQGRGSSRQSRGLGSRGGGADRARMPGRPGVRPGRTTRSRLPQEAPPKARFTGRAAVLVMVVAALMVSYASSMRAYLEQRDHIGTLEENIAASEQNIQQLRREKERWEDRAYVIAQARARFAFGFPGEIGYQVLDADGRPLEPADTLSVVNPTDDGEPEWWETSLQSIRVAGHPPAQDEPANRIKPPTDQKTDE